MNLKELFTVVKNNEAIVLFKVNEGVTKLDLIEHPFFDGTEEHLRLTKGSSTEITVFKKGDKNFSWHFGGGSSTMVSSTTRDFGYELLRHVKDELGIYMGDNKDKILKNLEEVKSTNPIKKSFKLMQWTGKSELTLHIDNEFHDFFPNQKSFETFMKNHYSNESERIHSIAQTGVNVYEFTATLNKKI